MRELMVDIPTADGAMDSFVVHPDEGGPFPAVFVYMDIWGLREELFDEARRIALAGYHVTLPNLWYRRGKVRYEARNEKGQMRSFIDLPQAVQDEMHANMFQVTDPMAMADTGAMLAFLKNEPVRPGPMGSVGYCLGGRLAILASAFHPERFCAAASLHGTRLVTDKPESPHRLAEKYRGEIYCGFAEQDHLAPPETIATLDRILSGRGNVHYRAQVHPGTVHGYSLPDRDVYDKHATFRDWERIFAMFRRQLR